MNVERYLGRIGLALSDFTRPDLDFLKKLQMAHILSVPYENVDVIFGKSISLDENDLFEKIVINRRGGLCFELNTIYNRLLVELGYKTESYFPRFWRGETGVPIPRHRVISVLLDGEKYITDVGIGSAAPRVPLLLREGVVTESFGESYRFERDSEFCWMLYELHNGVWQRYFSFTEEKYRDEDYIPTLYYCEKHPSSKFNKSLMVSLKTADGRRTIDGNAYKEFTRGTLTYINEDLSNSEIYQLLKEKFGVGKIDYLEDSNGKI